MFSENVAAFFDTSAGFAEYLTIGAASVAAIFDNAFSDPLGIVAGTQPVFIAATADVATLAVGDTVTRGATSYTVASIEPDGTGITRVMLKT